MKKFKVKSRLFSHKYKEILEKCRYTTRNVMCRKRIFYATGVAKQSWRIYYEC